MAIFVELVIQMSISEEDPWRFPSDQKFRFEFLEISSGEWNCYCSKWKNLSEISKQEDDYARFTQIFENFFLKISASFDFATEISGIFGWMARIPEI